MYYLLWHLSIHMPRRHFVVGVSLGYAGVLLALLTPLSRVADMLSTAGLALIFYALGWAVADAIACDRDSAIAGDLESPESGDRS